MTDEALLMFALIEWAVLVALIAGWRMGGGRR